VISAIARRGDAAAFPAGSADDRILATVMFSDIVSSTERAASIGDRRWREVLDHTTSSSGASWPTTADGR
jgi:class 3 adenylate cyclase